MGQAHLSTDVSDPGGSEGGPRRAPLPAEILELVGRGELPRRAVLAFALAERPDWPRLRARVVERCRWRLDRGDFGAYLAIAAGLVPAAEADPRGVARAAAAVARIAAAPAERQAERQAERLTRYYRLLGHPALFDALLAEVGERIHESPAAAGLWLGFAGRAFARLRALGRLPPAAFAEREVRWAAHAANIQRVHGDLPAAAAAFAALAADPARRRILGLAVHAELWSQESSLLRDLRRFGAAAALLVRCEGVHRALGDRSGLVRTLTQQGTVAEYAGDESAAIRWKAEAVEASAGLVDPRLVWTVHHNLATSLASAGRPSEAEALLHGAQAHFRLCADTGNRARRTWLLGKIARGREELAEAATKLRATVTAFEAQEFHFDAALARLDLAEVYLALNRPRRVRELASATLAAFEARGVGREALAAVALWCRAAAAECLHPAFFAELQRYLKLAQADPGYAFEPVSAGARRVVEMLARGVRRARKERP